MTDYAELEKRLREMAAERDHYGIGSGETYREAADAIAALTRELEEAKEALAPFIRVHSVGFQERQYTDTDAIYGRIVTTDPDQNCWLTAGDLRRAHAVHTRLSTAPAEQVQGQGEK